MRVRHLDFLRFGEWLAQRQGQSIRVADASRDLHVPVPTLHVWARRLRFTRALIENQVGWTVDRPRLLQVLEAHRIARLEPRLDFATSLTVREATERLRGSGLTFAWAMLTAANELAFYQPLASNQIYARRTDIARLRRLLPEGANPIQVFAEAMGDIPVVERNGIPVTGPFLTLLDCRVHPEGGAYAAFLATNVMRWAENP